MRMKMTMNKCDFCEGYKRYIKYAKGQNINTYMTLSVKFTSDESSELFKLNYCPKCGRDLRGNSDDES